MDSTHVQYTQTDTIRQTDGPLVPMVPIENGVIPVVLLVNMHLIKGTLIIFPCDLAGYRAIPMVHWYQWYDWYQWKMMSFREQRFNSRVFRVFSQNRQPESLYFFHQKSKYGHF